MPSPATTHKFTGDERDAETSFDHTQFRQYTSQLARWITPDPAGLLVADPSNPQSWNRYAYVLNNPMNFIDPFGLGGSCSIGGFSDFQLCIDAGGAWTNDPTDPCGANTNTCVNVGEPPPAAIPTTEVPLPDQFPGGGNTSGGFFNRLGNRLACAAEFGDAHSLASATGTQNSFLGKAFLGNTFSGLTQLGLLAAGGPSGATATDVGIAVLGGTHQGLPGGGNIGKGPLGVAQDAAIAGAATAGYNAVVGAGTQTLELGINASGKVATTIGGLSETAAGESLEPSH